MAEKLSTTKAPLKWITKQSNMAETKKGSRKAPRTHKRHWKDNTRNERQNKRNAPLNEKAKAKGWAGISEYLTAVINDKAEIPQKEK